MTLRKQLFIVGFSGLFLAGCTTLPSPVQTSSVRVNTHPIEKPLSSPLASASSPEALFMALSALGIDYGRGGRSRANGFDCSGLVAYVYHEAYGINLPHHTLAQSQLGKPIDTTKLQVGDLVFYNTSRQPYSHVGIYIGDDRFVHAPKQGSAVRIEKMHASYWTRRFDGARRIVD
jgi:cell wall-associated NlpC family hydrolase